MCEWTGSLKRAKEWTAHEKEPRFFERTRTDGFARTRSLPRKYELSTLVNHCEPWAVDMSLFGTVSERFRAAFAKEPFRTPLCEVLLFGLNNIVIHFAKASRHVEQECEWNSLSPGRFTPPDLLVLFRKMHTKKQVYFTQSSIPQNQYVSKRN